MQKIQRNKNQVINSEQPNVKACFPQGGNTPYGRFF